MHRLHDPTSIVLGVHAAHVFTRARMGKAIAFGRRDGPPDPRLGRWLCADCHSRQEDGLDSRYRFPLGVRVEATIAHNEATRDQPWPIPTE